MTNTHQISLTVNGDEVVAEVEPRTLLAHFLREQLRLTGTHVGCDTSNCGSCTLLIDDEPVKSCTVLAVQAAGSAVQTVEGLGDVGAMSPVQEGFRQEHGLQCGFCTPGMLMCSSALLAEQPDPSPAEIRSYLDGCMCRCTGYQMIVDAVSWAAANPNTGGEQ